MPRRQSREGRGSGGGDKHSTPSKQGTRGRGGGSSAKKRKAVYTEHISPSEAAKGLAEGTYVLASLRVNSRNRFVSFATVPGLGVDVCIDGSKDKRGNMTGPNGVIKRNRALERDIVVVKLDKPEVWRTPSKKGEDPPPAEEEEGDPALPTSGAAAAEGGPATTPGDGVPTTEVQSLSHALWAPTVDLAAHGGDAGVVAVDVEVAVGRLGLTVADVDGPLGLPSPDVLRRVLAMPKVLAGVDVPATPAALKALLGVAVTAEVRGTQPTGVVVGILAARGNRDAVGVLEAKYASDLAPGQPVPLRHNQVKLVPLDSRMPWIMIPREEAPAEFLADPGSFATTLFKGTITKWGAGSQFPLGHLSEALGQAGDIEVETQALLKANAIVDEPFSEGVMECLGEFEGAVHGDEFDIPPEEVAKRRDMRDTRIFSIDPWSARDLDDALHITTLPDGTIELGVHIADVSYFVKPGNALDAEAATRCTSVYLVQRVLPMLPRLLCESLCSLNPGVDRLAFSCIWRMRPNGELIEEAPWVGRTVIRSCAKLDYGTAQKFIDGAVPLAGRKVVPSSAPDALEGVSVEVWPAERRPSDGVAMGDVVADVMLLNSVAQGRRAKRFQAGAISLNRVKLSVERDGGGNPVGLKSYPIHDSNRLVEEYMLLANYLVAQHLITHASAKAVLRNHPPPLWNKVGTTVDDLRKLGFTDFTWKTSRSLQSSLLRVPAGAEKLAKAQEARVAASGAGGLAPPPLTPDLVQAAVESLVMKPMKPAEYFAAGSRPSPNWKHYALSIPYYTHFTSPIRRYADVMVHRLLQATLEGPEAVAACPEASALEAQCEACNERKWAAKAAQQDGDRVFMCLYLRRHPTERVGIVTGVAGANWFEVAVPEWGLEAQIKVERMGRKGEWDDKKRLLVIKPDVEAGEGQDAPAAPTGGPASFSIRAFQPIRLLLVAVTNKLPIDYEMIPSDVVEWNGPAAREAAAQAEVDGLGGAATAAGE